MNEMWVKAKCPVCGNPIDIPYFRKLENGKVIFKAAFEILPVHDDCHNRFLEMQRDRMGVGTARAIRHERG